MAMLDEVLTTTSVMSPSCSFNNNLHSPEVFGHYAFARCWLMASVINLDRAVHDKMPLHEDQMHVLFDETSPIYPGTRWKGNLTDDAIAFVSQMCKDFGSVLTDAFCSKLKICLTSANDCCNMQIAERIDNTESPSGHCPAMWDGHSCFATHPNGSMAVNACPESLLFSQGHITRWCQANGSWNDKTDYGQCTQMALDHYDQLHVAGIVCRVITIMVVIPACIIMLSFRSLRQQQRIRVHLCLLLASLMVAVTTLMWTLLVEQDVYDRQEEIVYSENPVWCRLLHLAVRYSYLGLFMWMFIEFFHLHRLLMHAFTVPKSLRFYYVFGYGFPLLITTIYGAVRWNDEESSTMCFNNASDYEWICFAPNLLALVLNFILMFRIVNVLVWQLAPHPNEPSSFRRALKAVIIMMPSMGVQYVLFMWSRPKEYGTLRTLHDMLEEILSSLHGALIALVFCYLNKEIQTNVKTPCLRVLRRSRWFHDRFVNRSAATTTMTTQYAPETTRTFRESVVGLGGDRDGVDVALPNNPTEETLIPLKPIYCPKGSNGQAGGDNGHSRRSNHRNPDAKPNGGIHLDDEVTTHLDPDGHRQ